MIEQLAMAAGERPACLLVRPNRSLSRTAFRRVLLGLGIATLAVAGLGATAGDVLAPLFALLQVPLVTWVFQVAWRRGDRRELITVGREALEVRRADGREPDAEIARFHPHWVRLVLAPARGDRRASRLLLTSHGQAVEIGAFLADEERKALANRVSGLLATIATQAPDKFGKSG